MRILLTNDDGIDAEGILLLERVARDLSNDVWVVAPAGNQSSCSRAITQTRKLRCEQLGERRYAIEGTPGDCAIVALNGLIPDKLPDLVLSGVNRGSNLGEDVALSGTVGACLQAWEQGVPGIACSQVLANFTERPTNWRSSEMWLATTLETLIPDLIGNPGVLNVNFPPLDDPQSLRGTTVAETGRRLLPLVVNCEAGASGETWFDYRSLRNKSQVTADSDIDMAYRGYITVTPLTINLSDPKRMQTCRDVLR